MVEAYYPVMPPPRSYQRELTQACLSCNTLVALPTGLGKTLIAAVTMYNFNLWYPQDKILFLAPTRPLVAQQLHACCSIVGIDPSLTTVLLDKQVKQRPEIWACSKIVFSTPHVVINDLRSQVLDATQIKLIIIDEAHRGGASNFAYAQIVDYLNSRKLSDQVRIIGLTATPGQTLEDVQKVVTNLNIERVISKSNSHPQIVPYINDLDLIKIDCEPLPCFDPILQTMYAIIKPWVAYCHMNGYYNSSDPSRVTHFASLQNQKKALIDSNAKSWVAKAQLHVLSLAGMLITRLKTYGILSFATMLKEKHQEYTKGKSKSKYLAEFWNGNGMKSLNYQLDNLLKKNEGKMLSDWCHSKFTHLISELKEFYENGDTTNSKCIVFVEMRDVALLVVKEIEKANEALGGNKLRPHIFLGQASKDSTKNRGKSKATTASNKRKRKKDSEEEESLTSSLMTTDNEDSSTLAHLHGLNQKRQNTILDSFKSSTYNILVATSIAEEGLDIGQVDLIITFDNTSSPIKTLQRMGRTGRKRQGKVVCLFAGNEHDKFVSAINKYEHMQDQLAKQDAMYQQKHGLEVDQWTKVGIHGLNNNGANLEMFEQKPFFTSRIVLVDKDISREVKEDEEELIGQVIAKTNKFQNKRVPKRKKQKEVLDWVNLKGGFQTLGRPSKRTIEEREQDHSDLLDELFSSTPTTQEQPRPRPVSRSQEPTFKPEVSQDAGLQPRPAIRANNVNTVINLDIASDDDSSKGGSGYDNEFERLFSKASQAQSADLAKKFEDDVFSDDEEHEEEQQVQKTNSNPVPAATSATVGPAATSSSVLAADDFFSDDDSFSDD